MKKLLFALLFIPTIAWANFDNCQQLFPDSKPTARAGDKQLEICHKSGLYGVLYDIRYKAATYCAEVLSTASIGRAATQKRTGDNALFHESTQLPGNVRSRLEDFKRSGYDRGHLCPYADLGPATNDLIQIQMQDPTMNREPWAKLESDTRKYVKRTGNSIYVITGVIHAPEEQRVKGVGVPTHFWKLVIDPTTNKSWAHIMPNRNDAQVQSPISKEALETILGYRLSNK